MEYAEYLNKRTKREIAGVKVRAVEENEAHVLIGTIPYNRDSTGLWFIEVITPQAFERSLQEKAEIKALVNHEASALLGSSRNGTLTLENGEEGLTCRCVLPKTSYAEDLYEVIKRGDVQTLSFGFIPRKYREKNSKYYLEDGDLFEVSFGVSFPAYEETTTIVERRVPMSNLVKRELDVNKLNEILAKEELTEAEITEVKELISLLEDKVGSKGGTGENVPAKEASWRSLLEKHNFKEKK